MAMDPVMVIMEEIETLLTAWNRRNAFDVLYQLNEAFDRLRLLDPTQAVYIQLDDRLDAVMANIPDPIGLTDSNLFNGPPSFVSEIGYCVHVDAGVARIWTYTQVQRERIFGIPEINAEGKAIGFIAPGELPQPESSFNLERTFTVDDEHQTEMRIIYGPNYLEPGTSLVVLQQQSWLPEEDRWISLDNEVSRNSSEISVVINRLRGRNPEIPQ